MSIERRVSRRDFDMLEALKNTAKQRISKGDNTVKSIIANIVRGKSLTYLAAAFAAFAAALPRHAQASKVWVGEGADEYYGTSGNLLNGPAGRGVYFVDGIEDNQGVMRNASNWTVRFDSYTLISGASIYIGRASQTDPDKIWTFIPDNDECGFYLDSGYDLEVGYNVAYGDGYLRMLNGKLAARRMYIGPNANDPTTKGVLSIGSAGRAATIAVADYIEILNGELTTTNTALTCGGNLTAANKNNASVTIDKTGGDWLVNGDIKMNVASGTTAVFYNRGGNLVVTNNLVVQSHGSGEFYMEYGHVTVSNMVRFAESYLSSGNKANLYLNGGVFEAKAFRFHNCDNSTGNVIFNGGTYKALADGDIAVHEGRMGYDYLRFKVGAQGGTIDTAGHDVISPFRLLQDGSSTGGICVKGGGSLTLENDNVTYTGKTCIEAGTTLVVSNSTVKSNILSQGIELVGAPSVGTEYTVFRCNDALDEGTDLANVTCPVAESFTTGIGADGKSIVVTATALKSGYWTGAKDNNLSDSANWSDGNVPTGNANIYCPVATTLTVGGTFAPSTITIPDDSAVVTIGAGALHVNTLTNASKLAIGAGASLEVDGDIVVRAIDYAGSMTFLNSNQGTVVVHGNAVGTSTTTASVFEYADVSEANNPMQVGGIRYMGAGHTTYFHLASNGGYHNDAPGAWTIGENGIGYTSGATGYYAEWYGHVKLYSSADWTLQNSMNAGLASELYVATHASMTFNTSDYNDPTIPRTITLKGRLRSGTDYNDSTAGFFIEGCGKVVIDTEDMSALLMDEDKKHTYFDNSQLTVRSGATLQINEGKKILGANGRIALEAGATLALVSSGTADFAERIESALKLPTEGAATIRIDGARLRGGDHTILSNVTAGTTANVNLDMASAALDGRKRASLAVNGGNLVLTIEPSAMIIVVR